VWGYKDAYLEQKARADRLEEELRELNRIIREDSLRGMADAKRNLAAAMETIATLRRGLGVREDE